MYSIYAIAVLTGVLYVIMFEIEQRFMYKQDKQSENINNDNSKPFKRMAKQLIMVGIASIASFFVVHQTKQMLHIDKTPNVFVNDPDF